MQLITLDFVTGIFISSCIVGIFIGGFSSLLGLGVRCLVKIFHV
ncbi:MAG: hypothetical protein RR812_07485 [Vagococcus sp.]